jgi:glycerophosphoryl diester phosphodiesterase
MKLIAHRALTTGKNQEDENKPHAIDRCIVQGFDVEIDVWLINGELFLGHDRDTILKISIDFLLKRSQYLWVHCKNFEAFDFMYQYRASVNYFWHTADDYTLTSKGYPWIFPGKELLTNGIVVMPEYFMDYNKAHLLDVAGICSDYIQIIKDLHLQDLRF